MPACILDLFNRHGLKPKQKTGAEWSSPCPACGGDDRCSIWPDDQGGRGYYWCRRCETQGDGIQFLRDFCGMSFFEACQAIGVQVNPNLAPPRFEPGPNKRERLEPKAKGEAEPAPGKEVNRSLWQEKATAFATWAHARIWENPAALHWLAQRGLDEAAVRRYGLGWNPGEREQGGTVRPRESWGLPRQLKPDGKSKQLWLPKGLVIPHLTDGADGKKYVRRLRVRRPDEERKRFNPGQKYFVVPGSQMDALYLPCRSSGPAEGISIIAVVESELDALLLHHLAGDIAGVISVGTSTIKTLPPKIFTALENADCVLVALDFDEPDEDGSRAGGEGWPRWKETFPRAKRWPVPAGKDPGEAFERGENLPLWLMAGIPEGLRFAMSAGRSAIELEKKGRMAEEQDPQESVQDRIYPWEVTSAMSRPAHPSSALGRSVGRGSALSDLWWAGVTVYQTSNGYRLQGHEQWPVRDRRYLEIWLEEYDAQIRRDLVWWARQRGREDLLLEARVSPESGNSQGRPDEVTSDQENSQPSCSVAVEA